jgi:hypothetical protein
MRRPGGPASLRVIDHPEEEPTMRRTLATTLAALPLPLALAAAPTATAAEPRAEHGSLVEKFEFDDTEYCVAEGVPSFHVLMSVATDYTVFYDAAGDFVRVIAHHTQKNTLAANGKTLYEEDHWTNVFYPDGTATTTGTHTHIRGDRGIVLRDAGRIVEAPDGTVEFMAGKWPQYSGATFCHELLP